VFADNPALAGTPTAPTAAAATNTTQVATTAHVFAERTNSATLTTKTINLTNNTLSGTKAQFNTACSDADFLFSDSGATDKIQPITASVGSSALTITLNATILDFRSATLGSGTVNTRTVASPISVVVSSGSTLGTVSAQQSRLAVLAIDNAGTVELAVVNIAGGNDLSETGLISTTAEGGAGAADSASTIYSTAARSNVPYRVVGYVESTQATAGTWATAPSTIQGYGGQAFAAMSSLGYGQTWQSVTRNSGTTYYNTTGKPIALRVRWSSGSANSSCQITVNGTSVGDSYAITGISNTSEVVIPPLANYVITLAGSGVSSSSYELR
jgi:hypothetical protein